MADIVMPRLSDTMEEGTILRWLKHDGEELARGEELVEIETDKATMTYESDQAGVLELLAAEGDTLPVGTVIARVGVAVGSSPETAGEEIEERSAPHGPTSGLGFGAAEDRDGQPAVRAPAAADRNAQPLATGERVRASPLARRMARESGVDLHAVRGSGPGGRIVKSDLAGVTAITAASSPAAAPPRPSTPPPPATTVPALTDVMTAKGETTEVELTRTQQTIARRMAESKATIPDFTLQADVDVEACVALREELKRLSSAQDAVPTYNDMVVKAAALALREHPRANGSYRDGKLQLHSRVNVGVAVAAHDALVVPTVFDADSKALGEIARETRALAERVRSGEITPPELGGGTFTVSNLGMFGVTSFTAIVNPPQAAILSVGTLEPRAVVRDGAVVARATLTLTLICDHRILYGADAAQLLGRIRELLESPTSLTL